MKYLATYNGFEIFQESDTKKIVVFVDTPDGFLRISESRPEFQSAIEHLGSIAS